MENQSHVVMLLDNGKNMCNMSIHHTCMRPIYTYVHGMGTLDQHPLRSCVMGACGCMSCMQSCEQWREYEGKDKEDNDTQLKQQRRGRQRNYHQPTTDRPHHVKARTEGEGRVMMTAVLSPFSADAIKVKDRMSGLSIHCL